MLNIPGPLFEQKWLKKSKRCPNHTKIFSSVNVNVIWAVLQWLEEWILSTQRSQHWHSGTSLCVAGEMVSFSHTVVFRGANFLSAEDRSKWIPITVYNNGINTNYSVAYAPNCSYTATYALCKEWRSSLNIPGKSFWTFWLHVKFSDWSKILNTALFIFYFLI